MKIIAVDDERHSLRILERAIRKAVQDAVIVCFEYSEKALEYAVENKIDVAFVDIEMDGMDGLVLAKHLKEIYGETNIVFVTGYSTYMKEAFDIRASGYLLKPVNHEHIILELENLRNPIKHLDKGIRVQCFGNFEVFAEGKPIIFSRAKSKEILAYLVDREGAGVNKKELAAVILEKEQYTRGVQSYLHTLIVEMIRSLKKVKAESIVIKHRNFLAVDTSKFICDYYNYEKGDLMAINSYHGEYMVNYSWAEFKIGLLKK